MGRVWTISLRGIIVYVFDEDSSRFQSYRPHDRSSLLKSHLRQSVRFASQSRTLDSRNFQPGDEPRGHYARELEAPYLAETSAISHPSVVRHTSVARDRQEAGVSGGELKTSIVTSHRHGDAGVAVARARPLYTTALICLSFPRGGDSRKQRTGHGGAEQKAIRSTTVRCCCRRSRGSPAPNGAAGEGASLLLLPRAGGGREKATSGATRGRAKCRELPVRKRAFRCHFYFVSAENSR